MKNNEVIERFNVAVNEIREELASVKANNDLFEKLEKTKEKLYDAQCRCLKLEAMLETVSDELYQLMKKEGDTKFIYYMGEKYIVTDISTDHGVNGNDGKHL